MSGTIIPFLEGKAFDPQLTHAMGEAYDAARQALHDKGQPELVQEIIAKRIIEIASTGERDPIKLCDRALAALGIAAV
jgi:hypothetical protein